MESSIICFALSVDGTDCNAYELFLILHVGFPVNSAVLYFIMIVVVCVKMCCVGACLFSAGLYLDLRMFRLTRTTSRIAIA